jgi:hypothetical protein
MSKTDKKYKGFREFYEDEGEDLPRKKPLKENKKEKMKFRQKLKNFDPKNLSEDEDFFDDFDEDYK